MDLLTFWLNTKSREIMKIFLVDDHAVLLGGLTKLIASEDGMTVVDSATKGQEALDKLTQQKIDLLITDYNLPDMDGLAIVQTVKRKYPEIKIIMLSMHDEKHIIKEVLKEGVNGYILKKDSHEELVKAIRAVAQGNIYLSQEVNTMLVRGLNENEPKLLTTREREILKLISQEMTNRQIAEELFISERTVETHRKNIFRKTGTHNMVGLIKFAYANNLI
ncbi:MAG: response regulator transcription factor [Cyclobacteriaceae bacterium]